MSELIVLENMVPETVFKPQGGDEILEAIREKAFSHVPDISTDKGRRAIASVASNVAKSKVFLDNARKTLKSDWASKVKVVDAEGKRIRDECDVIRDEVRKPLTDWEDSEKEKVRLEAEERARLAEQEAERKRAEEEAKSKKIEEDAELLRKDQEKLDSDRREFEEAKAKDKAEKDKVEREKLIAEQAVEAEKLRQKEEQEAKDLEAKQAIEKVKKDAEKARLDAEQAVKDAEIKRKEDEAKAKRLAAAEEKRISDEEKRKSADLEHRKKINVEALASLIAVGVDEDTGKELIKVIAQNKIKNITINY